MKKYISLLLVTAVLIGAVLACSIPSTAAVIGDTDGDGELTITDATYIQQHLARLITLSDDAERAGMVETGTTLSITDATLIQQKLAHLISAFPVEETDAPTEPPTDAPTEAPTDPPTEAPTEKETTPKMENNITVYFSNNRSWSTVNAYIYNYSTGANMSAWPGTAMTYHGTNNEGEQVYKVTVDVTRYDRIIFNNGSQQTTDTPITKASSGYFIIGESNGKLLTGLYPFGQYGEGTLRSVSLDYPDGYQKTVYIWLPEGYNAADTSKKYSVLYMCDGQNLFGNLPTLSGYEWECDETVLSMMQNGGEGVIVVGIDNSDNRRDHELTPNLGQLAPGVNTYGSFSNGAGAAYSSFVVDTVIPYIESRYNVNSIRGVAGSSSGGIEAFYIGMENLDTFDYIGALSPAFILYTESVWSNYLSEKDFSGDMPRIYFFNGKGNDALEQQLLINAEKMEGWLTSAGYPADRMKSVYDNDGTHSEAFWALYFPEMLSYGLDI